MSASIMTATAGFVALAISSIRNASSSIRLQNTELSRYAEGTAYQIAVMSRRNLLLCFDAFGTLFSPKQSVFHQYADVARSVGIGGFTDQDVEQAFRNAFKHESARHPNYGKASGLDATKWWTNVIRHTFEPLVGSDERVTRDLAPRLLHRFATEEGYSLYPDVRRLFQALRKRSFDANIDRVAVGVITNSDDRVPDVLSSLGLNISPHRYNSDKLATVGHTDGPGKEDCDIDFCVISYDVGAEKPDKKIFAAAEEMLIRSSAARDTTPADWHKVYVGDEYRKDVKGALSAGWNAVYVHREDSSDAALVNDVPWLDKGEEPQQLLDSFATSSWIAVRSLDELGARLRR